MMKRCLSAIIVIAFVISLAAPMCMAACACGKEHSYSKTQSCGNYQGYSTCNNDAWKKLGRGAANMVTFPLELTNQISKTNNSDGPIAAFTWGIVKGVGMTAFRAIVGVYEVISFTVPYPECYRPILTDPEFFFEDQIA